MEYLATITGPMQELPTLCEAATLFEVELEAVRQLVVDESPHELKLSMPASAGLWSMQVNGSTVVLVKAVSLKPEFSKNSMTLAEGEAVVIKLDRMVQETVKKRAGEHAETWGQVLTFTGGEYWNGPPGRAPKQG